MNLAKFISFLGVLAMSAVLIYGFTVGDYSGEASQLASMPWGVVSLVDLYTGFILFSGWIIYREKSLLVAIVWTVAMMVLGFFAGRLDALVNLYASQGDWRRFWLGKHA